MSEYHLTTPFSEETIRKLRVGDTVYLSGQAFTCRSRLQRFVFDEGNPSPEAVKDHDLLIHVGPILLREGNGWRVNSFMPPHPSVSKNGAHARYETGAFG